MNQSGEQSENKAIEEEAIANKAIEGYTGSVLSLNEVKSKFYERNSCMRISVSILKEMSDFSLLKQNIGFLLITLSNFFIFFGYFTPFLYITKMAEENGIPPSQASFLISIIGIVNIPARMAYGFVADKRFILPINLNTFAVLIGTLPLYFYFYLQYAFWSQAVFAVLLAMGIGLYSHFHQYMHI